jgi:hypothetical protein
MQVCSLRVLTEGTWENAAGEGGPTSKTDFGHTPMTEAVGQRRSQFGKI